MQKTIIKSLHPYGDFPPDKNRWEKISIAILKIKPSVTGIIFLMFRNVVTVTGQKNDLNNRNDKKLE